MTAVRPLNVALAMASHGGPGRPAHGSTGSAALTPLACDLDFIMGAVCIWLKSQDNHAVQKDEHPVP
jgi:hypothetical protein